MKQIVSALTSKGQVTVPKEIREHLGVEPPDKVVFVIDDTGRIELRSSPSVVAELAGSIPALPGKDPGDFDDLITEAFETMADRVVREIEGR